jgi:hypothetical protein
MVPKSNGMPDITVIDLDPFTLLTDERLLNLPKIRCGGKQFHPCACRHNSKSPGSLQRGGVAEHRPLPSAIHHRPQSPEQDKTAMGGRQIDLR